MKCPKCKQNLRCMRCGAVSTEDHAVPPGALVHNLSEELRNRCVCVELSKGVMREVLLLNDVEQILAMLTHP